MKQKLFLVVLLLAGFFFSAKAQDKSTGDQKIKIEGQSMLSTTSDDAIRTVFGGLIGGVENAMGNRSSLNLSKSFNGESISSETEFEVPQDARGINLNLDGSCKNGEIIIKIQLPDGTPFKSQKITSAADITWTTSLSFNDESSKKYKGTWKLRIQTNVCEGRYRLNISTR